MDNLNYLPWRNLNSERNYPFTDSSTLLLPDAVLPQSWILDARIYAAGNYMEQGCPYISRLVRSAASVALQVSSFSGNILGEALVLFGDEVSEDGVFPLLKDERVAGCLVLDTDKSYLMQSLDEGEYLLDSSVASFLPCVCEYLPGPQVTSLNGLSGNLILTGGEGIKVDKLDSSTIKISIVGDPHFNRYNCVEGSNDDANDALDLNGVFLNNLTVVHYVKGSTGQMLGPVISRLKKKPDGSVVLALKTPFFDPAQDTRDLRPAFRISVQGSSITFSMAGG